MEKKLLLIYNPHAGKGKIKSKLSDIIELFNYYNYEVTIYATRGKKDTIKLVEKAGTHYPLIVCSGGDGTLNEVSHGAMLSQGNPIIGYLPAGTVNDFAVSHKISRDLLKAAKMIMTGKPKRYDIGSLNHSFFTYVAAFGAFTNVSYETPQLTKNLFGRIAYFLEGVKQLPTLQSYKMKITFEGGVLEDEFMLGMVTNSSSIAGFRGFYGADISLSDGLFEVCFIRKPKNPIELQQLINALITREHNSNFIFMMHVPWLIVEAKEKISWTLDGEFGGTFRCAEIKNHRQALAYMLD